MPCYMRLRLMNAAREISLSNHFTATFPESFFIKMRMSTMPTKDGRIGRTHSHFKGGGKMSRCRRYPSLMIMNSLQL